MNKTNFTPGLLEPDGANVRSLSGRYIANCDTAKYDNVKDRSPEDRANAAEIVRRWNTQPALYEALELLVSAIDCDYERAGMRKEVVLSAARAALKLTEGGGA